PGADARARARACHGFGARQAEGSPHGGQSLRTRRQGPRQRRRLSTARAHDEQTVISRQKAVGWTLIVVSSAFIVYFLRERLFSPGPALEKKEWVQFLGLIVMFISGAANGL